MTSPINGKDKVLFFRLLKNAATKKAAKVLYQVSHTISYENQTEVKQTKDGNLQQSSGVNTTVNITAVATKDDVAKEMRAAVKTGEVVELWEVDLTSLKHDGKADALYMQAKIPSWEDPAEVGQYAEFTTTANVIGEPKEGQVTISQETLNELQYAFRDLEIADDL